MVELEKTLFDYCYNFHWLPHIYLAIYHFVPFRNKESRELEGNNEN